MARMTPTNARRAHTYLSNSATRYRTVAADFTGHMHTHFIGLAEDYERRANDLFDSVLAHLCEDCGRELTDPESIARGRGRVCHHKASA